MADNEGSTPTEPESQPAEHSTADYANYQQPESRRRPIVRKLGIGLAVLALLVVLGAGAYWLMSKRDNNAEPTATENQSQQTDQPTSAAGVTTKTKHHVSQNFQLEFDYPEDWAVKDDGGGVLTATSPDLELTDQDGRKVTGQITMTIRSKQQPLPEFDGGNAVAARDSEKVAYTKPSQTQRGTTHLSLLIYASSSGGEGDFDGVYITGDNGYKKGQDAPKTDFTAVDPIINVTYFKDGAQITVADNMWDNPNYSKPLKAMLQSLSIN